MTDLAELIRRSRRRKRLAAIALALLVLAAAGWFFQDLLLGTPVTPLEARRSDMARTVVANGRIVLPERVSVSSGISGRVARVLVRQGERVNAGDIVLELEAGEAQALLDQSQVELARAEARLRQLREPRAGASAPALKQGEAEVQQARRQLDRAKDLKDKGFVSQGAVNIAQRNLDVAEAALRTQQAQARPSTDGSEEAAARAALARARSTMLVAQTRLDEAAVRAPASGLLLAVSVRAGEVVTPGRELMAIDPEGEAEIELAINEELLPQIEVGQKAVASVTPDGERLQAEVAWIDGHVDAVRRASEVRLTISQPPDSLKHDVKVAVRIETGRRSGVLTVPSAAVREAGSPQPWVLAIADGRAERRDVKLGDSDGERHEILQGLAAGDQLVPAGSPVQEGQRVRVQARAEVAPSTTSPAPTTPVTPPASPPDTTSK
jgi:HlyD family secretion protein